MKNQEALVETVVRMMMMEMVALMAEEIHVERKEEEDEAPNLLQALLSPRRLP